MDTYHKFPYFVQNIIINMWAYDEHPKRYGKLHDEYLSWLRANLQISPDRCFDIESEKLGEIITHSYQHVPAYRKKFDDAGINPTDIKSRDDLVRIPLTSKRDVIDNYDQYFSDTCNRKKLMQGRTSGTTGTPMKIFKSLESYAFFHACVSLMHEWENIKLRDPSVNFGNKRLISPLRKNPPFWHYNRLWNQTYFSIIHMTEPNMKYYVDKIREINPVEIVGYASAQAFFGAYLIEHGVTGIKPRAIIANSEMVYPWQREIIKKAYGLDLKEWYSTEELFFFCYRCSHGNFHFLPGMGIVEVVADGCPVAEGESGEVVCTTLLNYDVPLIRFQLLDHAILGKGVCACGSGLPFLSEIQGKVHDYIVTPDGNHMRGAQAIFQSVMEIVEGQLIQESLEKFRLLIVPGKTWDMERENAIRRNFRKYYNYPHELEIEIVDKVYRTENQKVRMIVSKLDTKEILMKKAGLN